MAETKTIKVHTTAVNERFYGGLWRSTNEFFDDWSREEYYMLVAVDAGHMYVMVGLASGNRFRNPASRAETIEGFEPLPEGTVTMVVQGKTPNIGQKVLRLKS